MDRRVVKRAFGRARPLKRDVDEFAQRPRNPHAAALVDELKKGALLVLPATPMTLSPQLLVRLKAMTNCSASPICAPSTTRFSATSSGCAALRCRPERTQQMPRIYPLASSFLRQEETTHRLLSSIRAEHGGHAFARGKGVTSHSYDTRQIEPLPSSLTSSTNHHAPPRRRPDGPRQLLSSSTKPTRKSSYSPVGLPSFITRSAPPGQPVRFARFPRAVQRDERIAFIVRGKLIRRIEGDAEQRRMRPE